MLRLIRAAIMTGYTQRSQFVLPKLLALSVVQVLPERCPQTSFQSWFVVPLLNTLGDTSGLFWYRRSLTIMF